MFCSFSLRIPLQSPELLVIIDVAIAAVTEDREGLVVVVVISWVKAEPLYPHRPILG